MIFSLKLQYIFLKFYFPSFLQYLTNAFNFRTLSALHVIQSIRVLVEICPYCLHGSFLMLLIFFWNKVIFLFNLFPYTLPLLDLQLSRMYRYLREKNAKFSGH
jgi:hypothetical protein